MVGCRHFFMKFYLVLIIAFLYIPIAVLVVLSFNASRSRVVWGGFTLEWYQTLFQNSDVLAALQNTLTIGLGSALIATVIGLMAAVGIDAMKKRSYSLTLGVGNIPMLNADIVTGIALMLWFSRFTDLGYVSILLAHVTFNIPYVVLSILPKLQQMDVSVYEAARDLGAGSVSAFFRVVLPNIFPAVISGFFMAVTMSMDDFVVTYFTKGAGINTLSTMIYGELKRGINALGNPNLGAIDEYERVSTRYNFLTEQRDDVENAKKELIKVIADLTHDMKDIFVERFREIDTCFRQTFLELFGGGKAALELEDENNVLDCGIEIKVQPPGKALSTISLMSGGEMSFVAIALYFAILKVRPTPFCIMDEIDAALDEANVIRYAEYMRRMAGDTQFVVITHRRGTMEEADLLYGVTMQEKGVSSVIAVDLEEAERTIA